MTRRRFGDPTYVARHAGLNRAERKRKFGRAWKSARAINQPYRAEDEQTEDEQDEQSGQQHDT